MHVLDRQIQSSQVPSIMIQRRNHRGVVHRKSYITHIHYVEDFNDFELARTEKEHTEWDSRLGYTYENLSNWISGNILLNAKNYAGKPIRLTGGAPGEEV